MSISSSRARRSPSLRSKPTSANKHTAGRSKQAAGAAPKGAGEGVERRQKSKAANSKQAAPGRRKNTGRTVQNPVASSRDVTASHAIEARTSSSPTAAIANTTTASKGVRFVDITAEYAGQRIDNFLLRELRGAPKTLIYRLLRKGEVRVNKKRIKPPYKLQLGDQVRIAPVRLAAEKELVPVSQALTERIQSAVLFENDELLIINKPSGLAVHGGSGVNLGLIEALRQIRPDARFLELVHRLDRETSGCVMIAKKRSALRALHEDLREDRIDKIYRALVIGHWPRRKQHIKLPLKKNELKSGERVVRPDPAGKQALTEFKVLEDFTAGYSLVQAKPITGRTHQIRVHCQQAGHAIVGDDKYGEDAVNVSMKALGCKRLYLHAYELRLRLPKSKEKISVIAPEDPRLLTVLQALREQNASAH